jgi:hypothetical protein
VEVHRRREDRGELYGRALVVIAAEQHATRLVVPSSQRMPATRWSSHKDLAAKALKKLAGPHVPTTLTRLEQAVKRAHAIYDKAEVGAREERRSVKGLHDEQARLVRPDAVLEVVDRDDRIRTFLIEYDRTRRVDKNFTKFRRYDAFLNWWWRDSRFGDSDEPPFVVFVCQDGGQRKQFMAVADRELTGHRWHPSVGPADFDYVGRRHVLFAVERDVHAGAMEGWRLPAFPPDHPSRVSEVRRVRLPSDSSDRRSAGWCDRSITGAA